ncbi:MAG: isochorismatase family protein [Propionicimonas sp.]
MSAELRLPLRSFSLARDPAGCAVWQEHLQERAFDPRTVALLISDMWDQHWSAGATHRVAQLAPRIDALADRLRRLGAQIVHAPADTEPFYADHPARLRLLGTTIRPEPVVREVTVVPSPVFDSDGGSDTGEPQAMVDTRVWTRQHPSIHIDEERDVIAHDEGTLIRSYLRDHGITTIIYAGVHANLCVLRTRTFSIVPSLRVGFDTVLAGRFTDAMYNPAQRPYVAHDVGTRLVVEHIAKHYCPVVWEGL